MARVCQVTGKKRVIGNNVSHSKRRTKREFAPNLKVKRFWLEEENRFVTLKVSAAKKAKGNRVQVILECTEQKDSGVPGISRYITTKNKKNTTERLERRKYNPYLRRVTVHKEIK